MRIALFTDTYLPNINGVVTSVELLRKKLEEQGHEAYVVCTYPGLMQVKTEGRIIRIPGIEVKQLYGYSLAQPFHMMLEDELEGFHFDLVHCHTEFGVGLFGGHIAKAFHIPLVRTYHTTYEDYTHYINPMDLESLEGGLKKAVSYLSKLYGNSCVRMIAPSEKTKELLLSYKIKTPIDVIPTGVDLERFRAPLDEKLVEEVKKEYGRREGEKLFLYVGRIAREKSIDMLIKAFKLVKDERLNARLLIVGAGPGEEELHELVKELDLGDTVIFLGKKENTSIPAYYRLADCFLSASTSETQGMTYIEALASGIAVMGRYDEAVEDLILEGKNGYYFNDETELFEKIKTFLSLNEEEIGEMKIYEAKAVEPYDADVFVKKVLQVYENAKKEYDSMYTIEKFHLKDDYVVLTLVSSYGGEEKMSVSLDDCYGNGLRADQKISQALFDTLKAKEAETLAYSGCLRRLANRDYSVRKMREYIQQKYELDSDACERVLKKLEGLDLLDDRKYARNKASVLDKMFYSKKKIIEKLRREGIAEEYIRESISEDEDSEISKAMHQAKRYQNSTRNKSLSLKKQTILKKLIADGYSYDTAKKALGSLDFNDEVFEEKDLLKKEALKARKRLMKKYQGTDLRNRLYYALYSKGFQSEAIYALISEMEDENG